MTSRLILNHVYPSAATLFDENARDACTEPYVEWRKTCAAIGYAVEGVEGHALEDAEWLVIWDAWDIAPSARRKARYLLGKERNVMGELARLGNVRPKLALMLFEPPSIIGANEDESLHEQFDVVFTWSPRLLAANPARYKQIYLPSPTAFPPATPRPFGEKKLLADISSWKFSSHPRELYTERKKTIRFFEREYPNDFDLYGQGWNPSVRRYLSAKLRRPGIRWEQFPSYRGSIGSKADVFPRYKFSTVFENMSEPGYVSVKIFDCLRSDCVPVYLGAPDIDRYVDAGAFVDRRNFQSNEELGRYLAGMSETEYEGYRAAIRRYLESDRFHWFLSPKFVELMNAGLGLSRVAEPVLAGVAR